MTTDDCRTITFVTGTRAEFGLMRSVLRAIHAHPRLRLRILATGMHLDPAHGSPLQSIRDEGWAVDEVIPWPASYGNDRTTDARVANARHTGHAAAAMADAFAKLKADIVLVVGDRVEAFAAASAAHISGVPVAHVHGGDRAAGQVDDALRHAITKLSHIHFPATRQSADRLFKLGEDRRRIVRAGSPGLDGIARAAAPRTQVGATVGRLTPHRFALLLLHPAAADEALEHARARLVLDAAERIPFEEIVVVYPNNDPGAAGIMRCWAGLNAQATTGRIRVHRDLPRGVFLALIRDAAVLLGNSSSGIIEAASFGTPVLNVGPRQAGREHGSNVTHVTYSRPALDRALLHVWNDGRPRRFRPGNIYAATARGGGGAASVIANTLARVPLDDRLLRKLIRY